MMIALRNPDLFCSVSAFSPIVAPSRVPWGQKALAAYLGDDQQEWKTWDTCEIIAGLEHEKVPLLVEQGKDDRFLTTQLQPERLEAACAAAKHPITLRLRPGYDHSYYFIASFVADHIAYHAEALRGH